MLVKKVNPEWKPSENPDIKVGEIVDITNPQKLIIDGDVVGLGEHGEERSAYDLYGVLVKSELDEFKEFSMMKKAQALKKQLEAEQVDLKKISDSLDKKEAPVAPAKPVAAPVATPPVAPAPAPVAAAPAPVVAAPVVAKK